MAAPAGTGHCALSARRRHRHHGADPVCKAQRRFQPRLYIENRSGASGTRGESIVARSAHDGYTLLHDSTAFSVNGSLYAKLHLDYARDFVPVFLVSQAPAILAVTPSAPVKTVAELISLAKSSPHGIEMASAGFGSLSHLCLEIFRHKAGITVHHVPYRGGAQALNDLMSGHVKYFFGSAVTATGLIKAGKLRGLAHTWRGQLTGLPDIPPISDTFPGFEALDWNGVFVPTARRKQSCTSSMPASTRRSLRRK